jgi:Capsule polysaccharide export protein
LKGISITTKSPIYYLIGVEGHFLTAQALGRELDCPVVGILTSQSIEYALTPERRSQFSRLESFPAFYREHINAVKRLSRAALDGEQDRLEKDFGISAGSVYAYYDRAICTNRDYLKVRHYQVICLLFIEHLLQQERPAFVLDGVATYFQHALRSACRNRSIPYLHSMDARNERIAFFTPDGQQIGMRQIFMSLRAGRNEAQDAEKHAVADTWYSRFLNKPQRPEYAERCSRLNWKPTAMLGKLARELNPENWKNSNAERDVDYAIGYRGHPISYIKAGIIGMIRARFQLAFRIFDGNPDLEVPYIYLPLHYAPEISDIVFGADYDHHEGLVLRLAKHIPFDTQLYVKEHTSMLGRRPTSFYRTLSRFYNVRIISPTVDTFTLIRYARAVITVTGTAGWEAYLLGKPVIVLGDVFYNFLPGILHTNIDSDLYQRINNYLQEFSVNQDEQRDAVRAWFLSSYPAKKGDIGYDTRPELAQANAMAFARAFNSFLANWSEQVEGRLPDDLLYRILNAQVEK